MNTKKIVLATMIVGSFGLGLGISRAADVANPETNASDRNLDTNQPNSVPGAMQKTEDGANRALNNVDAGVHKGVAKTHKGAHKAHKKAKKAMANATEPAVEPMPVAPAQPAN